VQPLGVSRGGIGANHAGIDEAQPPLVERHHPKAALSGAGIDAERDHTDIVRVTAS
jgi:hypothetical protein